MLQNELNNIIYTFTLLVKFNDLENKWHPINTNNKHNLYLLHFHKNLKIKIYSNCVAHFIKE